MRQPAILIANPKSGRFTKRKIEKAVTMMTAAGMDIKIFHTENRGDAQRIAGEAVDKGVGMVIAAGGDGTINEVINGLAFKEIPLGIIPVGTTNVLAIELNIRGIADAVARIINAQTKDVSLGRITRSDRQPYYFILMAGIGFDAVTIKEISNGGKRMFGKAAYIISGFWKLFKNGISMVYEIDGREYRACNAIVCNAVNYGGRFRLAPDADIVDPSLYVNLFEGDGYINISRYVAGIITGRLSGYRDVRQMRCREVIVKGSNYVQIDGDYYGVSPCVIDVVPNALRLIC